jgi:hypothetical protein
MYAALTRTVIIAMLAGATACGGGAPDRKTFAEKWQTAVAAKDGAAAWNLLDKASRARIVDGLTRTQAKAAADEKWRQLFAAVNAPLDVTQPPEALAIAMLALQLGNGLAITDDGKTPHIHTESGAWRVRVDPVGWHTEGLPLSLTLRLPAADPPVPSTTSIRIEVQSLDRFTGQRKTPAEVDTAYRTALAHVVEESGLSDHFSEGAYRIMRHFHFGPYDAVQPPGFEFDPLNTITPHVPAYDNNNHYVRTYDYPTLTYGAWPAAN